MLPELYTIQEVAAHLRVRPSTVKGWIRAGQLRCLRRGRNWVRVSRQAVEGFLHREAGAEPLACPEAFRRAA